MLQKLQKSYEFALRSHVDFHPGFPCINDRTQNSKILVWYQRHFWLDIDALCIRYGPALYTDDRILNRIWSKIKKPSAGKVRKRSSKLKAAKTLEKRNLYTIDIADIAEVRFAQL